MKRRRKRKCHGCCDLFLPDPRNRDRQAFCGKPGCVKLSAKRSRVKWTTKNPDHFKGRENVIRVQQWREGNPGYWRRKKGSLSPGTLQEDCIPEAVGNARDVSELKCFALQENWFSQPLLLVGLVANLTGNALQEDIVASVISLQKRGREILGIPPGIITETRTQVPHEKENHRSVADPPHSGPV